MNKKSSKDKKLKRDPDELLRIKQNIPTEEFREQFPNLYEEITQGKDKLEIDQVLGNKLEIDSNNIPEDPLKGYTPNIFDYLARAEDKKQACEVIDFLEKRSELSSTEAQFLRNKVENEGVRSLGELRRPGHYFRKAEEIRSTRLIEKSKKLREKK